VATGTLCRRVNCGEGQAPSLFFCFFAETKARGDHSLLKRERANIPRPFYLLAAKDAWERFSLKRERANIPPPILFACGKGRLGEMPLAQRRLGIILFEKRKGKYSTPHFLWSCQRKRAVDGPKESAESSPDTQGVGAASLRGLGQDTAQKPAVSALGASRANAKHRALPRETELRERAKTDLPCFCFRCRCPPLGVGNPKGRGRSPSLLCR